MEYEINDFVDNLRTYIYGFFPDENDDIKSKKHADKPLHIKDIAFMWLPTTPSGDGNTIMFDIGSDYAEENYPYYHILEDAQYIHKKNRATKTSKGSQAKITTLSKRDYGRVNFNGKTYSKEYSKNVRGERKKLTDTTTTFNYRLGKYEKIERNSDYYLNVHYNYIEKILDYCVPLLADYYGMKVMRKKNAGLEEEYNEQYEQDKINMAVGNWGLDILDIMQSFN